MNKTEPNSGCLWSILSIIRLAGDYSYLATKPILG